MIDTIKKLKNAPKIIQEWIKIYGTKETIGSNSNPMILSWVKELNDPDYNWYNTDSIPWCSLAMAIVAKRAGKSIEKTTLAAKSWVNFGTAVKKTEAVLGDTLIFSRTGGGHVATYICEDSNHFYVIGGNQGDMVGITKILKSRLFAVRRPIYSIKMPEACKKYFWTSKGAVSTNEQ